MPGLSIHAVDVTRGVPAAGMRVAVFALSPSRRQIADGILASSGALDHAITTIRLEPGPYEVIFHAGDFFSRQGVPQSTPSFLDEVPFRFNIADPNQHYHLPMKITPWGFSLYRGS
jgi:5-hydroxyisourate hydrolase